MAIVNKDKGCTPSTIGYYLVILGAINWGLVGLSDFTAMNLNVVSLLVGGMPALESLIYIIIGIAGVVTCYGCRCSTCKACRVDEAKK